MTLLDTDLPGTGHPAGSVAATVAAHLGGDPTAMPMLTLEQPFYDDINLQTALDAWAARDGHNAQLFGANAPSSMPMGIFRHPTLAGLLTNQAARFAGVRYARRACGIDQEMLCLDAGLLLLTGPTGPLAVWIREAGRRPQGSRAVDVIAPTIGAAEAFLVS